jgi:prevent-host-death family protein
MGTRFVTVTEAKNKLPSLLDEIEQHGQTVTITRRGRPVAELRPAKKKAFKPLKDSWAGRVEIVGDIVNTPEITDLFECLKESQDI